MPLPPDLPGREKLARPTKPDPRTCSPYSNANRCSNPYIMQSNGLKSQAPKRSCQPFDHVTEGTGIRLFGDQPLIAISCTLSYSSFASTSLIRRLAKPSSTWLKPVITALEPVIYPARTDFARALKAIFDLRARRSSPRSDRQRSRGNLFDAPSLQP